MKDRWWILKPTSRLDLVKVRGITHQIRFWTGKVFKLNIALVLVYYLLLSNQLDASHIQQLWLRFLRFSCFHAVIISSMIPPIQLCLKTMITNSASFMFSAPFMININVTRLILLLGYPNFSFIRIRLSTWLQASMWMVITRQGYWVMFLSSPSNVAQFT